MYNQTQISADASKKLLQLAQEGLPIFIVDEIPIQAVGSVGSTEVKANIKELTSGEFSNVQLFDTTGFSATTLTQSGIKPRVMLTSSSGNASENLYTFWRSEKESGTDLVYIVNQAADDGPYSTFTFSFESAATSTAYILDA